ncbi:hypothetical protein SCOR_11835 [Sulfidibacter corallicola]|uniref:Uncharacterized protein n=1 Tax=Sulfidibacter corallicola TaxID=2818388 RepID=A0A8A4TGX5_SULCO|nr:hypothetical protein [Sulfidibacter corallicola]QTD47978.1 hypothetical protein J3U87_20520 [Sulfidibacter corallicola]
MSDFLFFNVKCEASRKGIAFLILFPILLLVYSGTHLHASRPDLVIWSLVALLLFAIGLPFPRRGLLEGTLPLTRRQIEMANLLTPMAYLVPGGFLVAIALAFRFGGAIVWQVSAQISTVVAAITTLAVFAKPTREQDGTIMCEPAVQRSVLMLTLGINAGIWLDPVVAYLLLPIGPLTFASGLWLIRKGAVPRERFRSKADLKSRWRGRRSVNDSTETGLWHSHVSVIYPRWLFPTATFLVPIGGTGFWFVNDGRGFIYGMWIAWMAFLFSQLSLLGIIYRGYYAHLPFSPRLSCRLTLLPTWVVLIVTALSLAQVDRLWSVHFLDGSSRVQSENLGRHLPNAFMTCEKKDAVPDIVLGNERHRPLTLPVIGDIVAYNPYDPGQDPSKAFAFHQTRRKIRDFFGVHLSEAAMEDLFHEWTLRHPNEPVNEFLFEVVNRYMDDGVLGWMNWKQRTGLVLTALLAVMVISTLFLKLLTITGKVIPFKHMTWVSLFLGCSILMAGVLYLELGNTQSLLFFYLMEEHTALTYAAWILIMAALYVKFEDYYARARPPV